MKNFAQALYDAGYTTVRSFDARGADPRESPLRPEYWDDATEGAAYLSNYLMLLGATPRTPEQWTDGKEFELGPEGLTDPAVLMILGRFEMAGPLRKEGIGNPSIFAERTGAVGAALNDPIGRGWVHEHLGIDRELSKKEVVLFIFCVLHQGDVDDWWKIFPKAPVQPLPTRDHIETVQEMIDKHNQSHTRGLKTPWRLNPAFQVTTPAVATQLGEPFNATWRAAWYIESDARLQAAIAAGDTQEDGCMLSRADYSVFVRALREGIVVLS